jgi:hypothetical protein
MISLSMNLSASGLVEESAVEDLRAKANELKAAAEAAGASAHLSFSPAAELPAETSAPQA